MDSWVALSVSTLHDCSYAIHAHCAVAKNPRVSSTPSATNATGIPRELCGTWHVRILGTF